MTSPVIDLSHHNPQPNWSQMKQAGVLACIMKASQGISYQDPTWDQRSRDAASAGLLVCPYHFLEGGQITKQMDWFLGVADPPQGGRLVLDHETDATLDELCQAVTYLWSKRPDLQLTVYSGHTIKEQLGDITVRGELLKTSLWIAQYNNSSSPAWPRQQWGSWSLWQWTDRETVPGISQPVDGNRWNGSPENLVRWMSPTASQPQPAPEEDVPVIVISMPVGYRLEVNGKVIEYG
jgi:GH25 family lysozyme M1 (1,4-beta-N-acetylmuramidase)